MLISRHTGATLYELPCKSVTGTSNGSFPSFVAWIFAFLHPEFTLEVKTKAKKHINMFLIFFIRHQWYDMYLFNSWVDYYIDPCIYCMTKKSWLVLHSNLLYKIRQAFLDSRKKCVLSWMYTQIMVPNNVAQNMLCTYKVN